MRYILLLYFSTLSLANLYGQTKDDLSGNFYNVKINTVEISLYFNNNSKYAWLDNDISNTEFFFRPVEIDENVPWFNWDLKGGVLYLEMPVAMDEDGNITETKEASFYIEIHKNVGAVFLSSLHGDTKMTLYLKENVWKNAIDFIKDF